MAAYIIQSTRPTPTRAARRPDCRRGAISWQAAAEHLASAVGASIGRHRDRPGMGRRPSRLLNRDVFFAASERLQFTQRALSRQVGLTEETLCKIVPRQRGASPMTIEALSEALGGTPDEPFFAYAYREKWDAA